MSRNYARERIAAADENSLGRILLDHKPPLVTAEDLERGLEEAARRGCYLGVALVSLGILKKETLRQVLLQQTSRKTEDPMQRASIALAMADRSIAAANDAIDAHANLVRAAKA